MSFTQNKTCNLSLVYQYRNVNIFVPHKAVFNAVQWCCLHIVKMVKGIVYETEC